MRWLWEPRQPMWWLYVSAVVVGGLATWHTLRVGVVNLPGVGVTALIYAVLLGTFLLWVLSHVSPLGLPRAPVVVLALAWGAMVAPAIAVSANDHFARFWGAVGLGDWAASLSAPPDEEGSKLLGVLVLLYLTRQLTPRPLDGFLYGGIVGVGFEVCENALYLFNGALQNPNSDATGAVQMIVARSFIGVGGHVMFTAISGTALAYALTNVGASRARHVGVATAGLATAMFLHGLWDAPQDAGLSGLAIVMSSIAKWLFIIGLFLLAAHLARRVEYVWIRDVLSPESPDVVSPTDVDALVSHGVRREQLRAARRAGGRAARRQLEHRYEALLDLADLRRDHATDHARVLEQRARIRELHPPVELLHR